MKLLSLVKVVKDFPLGILGRERIRAVDRVSFDVYDSAIFALIGESGSGKTTIGKLILGLLKPTSGEIIFNGQNVSKLLEDPEKYYRNVQGIFQDPFSALNPVKRIGQFLERPLKIFKIPDVKKRLKEVLSEVELPFDSVEKYPHELSGGQRQRVVIARSIITRPKIILADEPTSMLDVSIKASILNLILRLRDDYSVSFIHVTHDLASAKYISDRIAVMYAGQIIEEGYARDLVDDPLHPYTKLLRSAAPDPNKSIAKIGQTGEPPDLIALPNGCAFKPRCPYASKECSSFDQMIEKDGRKVRCILYR
ncbi:MAG TPA: ABC transporter ATP-binding protein [Pseudothermotoga sp.]|nr:ABC transporter ATP-binding protein [Pseudothermotoga sp.]HOK83264.1 ABC transporter ATP-binding protein [Pseudothermotoga sp.]HPP70090.1 ABC transporter ATP-binding protein [Pseudothermotoga sp.]